MDTDTLWDFALRIYARTGVEHASLRLQNEYGADVPVLLFSLWMGSCGRALSRDDLEGIVATAQNWQDAVVGPLRQARVALRQLDSLPLWLRPEAAALQEYIKAVELRAEKRELEWLESFSPVGVVRDRETAAAHNVLTFLDFWGLMQTGSGVAMSRHCFSRCAPRRKIPDSRPAGLSSTGQWRCE
jgi:uncharacterized protein (TIGR02444 family)